MSIGLLLTIAEGITDQDKYLESAAVQRLVWASNDGCDGRPRFRMSRLGESPGQKVVLKH